MKCSNCEKEVNGNFCDNCGTAVTAKESSKNYEEAKKILIDPSEKVKSILCNNFLQTYISTGTLGNGFAILTDKRVYFKGKCFFRKGKGFYSKTEEKTVDLKDVTGTGFVHNKAIWAKVVSRIMFWYGVFMFAIWLLNGLLFDILNNGEPFSETPIGMVGSPILLLLLYLVFKFIYKTYNYSVFEISYAGGGIAFDMNWITQQESKDFQQQLILLKQVEKESIVYDTTKAKATDDYTMIPKLLMEYKQLLDSGIITQEEFDAKKKELLNK